MSNGADGAAPAGGLPGVEARRRVLTADVAVRGPVDGTNEFHPDGAYYRIILHPKGSEREERLFSRGAAECLRDELTGLLERTARLAAATTADAAPAAPDHGQGAAAAVPSVEAMAERLEDGLFRYHGTSVGSLAAESIVAYVLTGLLPGPELSLIHI